MFPPAARSGSPCRDATVATPPPGCHGRDAGGTRRRRHPTPEAAFPRPAVTVRPPPKRPAPTVRDMSDTDTAPAPGEDQRRRAPAHRARPEYHTEPPYLTDAAGDPS
ncbi:hypothetical protein TPA0906_15580 [Streptomyces olivaceus]|nr:hypothetical protein TPA0906_15580 [Streptomyces olivaceus]